MSRPSLRGPPGPPKPPLKPIGAVMSVLSNRSDLHVETAAARHRGLRRLHLAERTAVGERSHRSRLAHEGLLLTRLESPQRGIGARRRLVGNSLSLRTGRSFGVRVRLM